MSTTFFNEPNLITALKKGDANAYSYLVETYHHKLCVYAFGLIKNHDQTEDIVQNVFVSVWKNRKNLKDDFSIKNYLYKSVYNEFIDQYRKKKNILAIEQTYVEALNNALEEEEEEEESSLEKLMALVNLEIKNLPPKCKQTFLLSKQEGLTNIEIAEYLNVSLKSVEAHMTKAFGILRKTVGDKMNGILFLLFGIN